MWLVFLPSTIHIDMQILGFSVIDARVLTSKRIDTVLEWQAKEGRHDFNRYTLRYRYRYPQRS